MTAKSDMRMIVKRHFNPAFKMLEKIVETCPDDLWNSKIEKVPFWQQIYHAVTGIDFWFREGGEFTVPKFSKDITEDLSKESNTF